MNDNNEKNNPPKEGASEPITKKVAKFSAFIYLGLAITVVIVATVGIFSISYDYEESLAPVSFPEINTEKDYSIPQIVITPDDIPQTDTSTDAPVVNEESGVDAEVETPDNETRIMYYFPVEGEITKGFSMDALVYSETMKDYRVHSGIDIAAEVGTPVLCFTDGIVSGVSEDYFYGMTVAVSHKDGSVSYYMNLDPTLAENIAIGSEVAAGQTLGTVGTTAKCENMDTPHLHFEMRYEDALIDPAEKLPR